MQTLRTHVATFLPTLLPEQVTFFNAVMEKITNKTPGILFLNAAGGTGKTHLLNLVLAQIRSEGNIAVAVATSGIAATLLDGGRTAHSSLKIPLEIITQTDGKLNCNIDKNSQKGELLRRCKLLVWDEATMAHKKLIEAVNNTLQDIRSNNSVMGGLLLVLAGDFRQTLPIVPRGTPSDQINACIKNSDLWQYVEEHTLITNMRAPTNNFSTN